MALKLEKNIRQITLAPELNSSKSVRALIYAMLFLILFFLFYANVTPTRYNYKVGDIAVEDIKAPTDAINTKETQRRKDEAVKQVPKIYKMDTSVEEKALSQASDLFQMAEKLIADNSLTREQKRAQLQKIPIPVREEILDKLITITPNQLSIIRNTTNRFLSSFLGKEFSEDSLATARTGLDSQLVSIDLDTDSRVIVRDVVLALLTPNMVYDEKSTKELQEQAKQKVPDVHIQKGELVVHKGEMITPDKLAVLSDLKLLEQQPNYRIYIGLASLLLFSLFMLEVYLRVTNSKLATNNSLLLLLVLVILLTALVMFIVSLVAPLNTQSMGYLAPLAMGTMLLTILFDTSLGIVGSIIFTMFTAVLFDFRFEYLFVGLVSSMTGVFAVTRVKHRLVIMRAAFVIAAVNLLAISTVQALSSANFSWHALIQALLFGLLNGLLSAILTIGVLPFLESLFGILTPISLLELSNPNHPLLKKLLMEAPGTYHHSLIVGNLAETAAEMVGGDPLLCRVGGYFHDVGKSKRPMFFIENQNGRENPHDKVAPSLSHLIITSHVRDGVEMQEQYRLPKPIRDICEQHHGTTVLWYFYNKALELDKNSSLNVDDFRYSGPKPQTKEAAVIMLCDSVEAAVRSMSKPTPNRIEAVIRKIIKDRLNDGQLDECSLTLKDLDKIAEALMITLNGIYHARIEYPEPPKPA
ncbi:HD family phosphohydrolase [Effusibacillus dendaii]|uniref:HD family phosphohydrolase n=1 Tax=Effusibacillus dendaii TaxID=2743772 RepID=A0A7I8DCH4_9BACL|nr:HDIG domain-containing metalloprotein [Effusibacillus dendaii]BCJ86220.1 HD family phosphohydrolase [Effusibacillus dendaii]